MKRAVVWLLLVSVLLSVMPAAFAGRVEEFVRKMEDVFDPGCCFVLDVRPAGPAVTRMEPAEKAE